MSKRNLTTSMDTLFPDPGSHTCRVCGREYDDGRRSYCSDRCKHVANAVAEMYNWQPVRKQVLERDDYTCQNCGKTKKEILDSYREKFRAAKPGNEPRKPGLHVDHIEPLSDGGHPFDESNLVTLCPKCHHDKTAIENRKERSEIPLSEYMEN